MDKQQVKDMKRALDVLKYVLLWARRDQPKHNGEAAICLRGNQLSYSSLQGTTAGVNMPGPRVDREPVYVRESLLKAAMLAKPGAMDIDYANCTINGLSFSMLDSKKVSEKCLAADVNQTFGRVKTLAVIPLPGVLNEVRSAEAFGDIRYYLNGTCFDLDAHAIVATNGHRLHVANSDTLPVLAPAVLDALRRKTDENDTRKCQFILASWQLDLLKKMGATRVSVGRFPVHAKGDPEVPGWIPIKADSQSYLVRTKAEFGFFIGKSCDGLYPDWQRVVPTAEALLTKRINAAEAPESHRDWRAFYPRSVEFPENAAETLRKFVKAESAARGSSKASEFGCSVVIDLHEGMVKNPDASEVPLRMPIRVLDHFVYDMEKADHLAGVNATYLAEALEYVGLKNWFVSPYQAFIAHKDARAAAVMPKRI